MNEFYMFGHLAILFRIRGFRSVIFRYELFHHGYLFLKFGQAALKFSQQFLLVVHFPQGYKLHSSCSACTEHISHKITF